MGEVIQLDTSSEGLPRGRSDGPAETLDTRTLTGWGTKEMRFAIQRVPATRADYGDTETADDDAPRTTMMEFCVGAPSGPSP